MDNIKLLIADIFKLYPYVDVLIVDDNSPDGTADLLNFLAKANKQIKFIKRTHKLGLGSAHHLAMLYAIKNNYDVLVTMDADLSHNPQDISKLLEKLDRADFVIGARYVKGGGSDYTGYRKFLSKTAGIFAKRLLFIPLDEFTSSFRAFRVNKLKNVNFLKMHNNGYTFMMESIVRFHQAGLILAQIPSYFYNRTKGSSKIPRFEIFSAMLKLLHLFISRIFRSKFEFSNIFINDTCGCCSSKLLSVRYLEKRSSNNDILNQSNTFRCSDTVLKIK